MGASPYGFFCLFLCYHFFYYNFYSSKLKTKMATKKTNKASATTYVPVSKNVYFDGTSYRTRVSKNGVCYSKNFSSKRKAITYRNELLPA